MFLGFTTKAAAPSQVTERGGLGLDRQILYQMGGGLTSCHPPWCRPANHTHSCNKRQHVTGWTAWNMYDILPVSVNTGWLVERTERRWETITNVPESPRKLKHLTECVAMKFSVHSTSLSTTTAVILGCKKGLKGFYRSYLDRYLRKNT